MKCLTFNASLPKSRRLIQVVASWHKVFHLGKQKKLNPWQSLNLPGVFVQSTRWSLYQFAKDQPHLLYLRVSQMAFLLNLTKASHWIYIETLATLYHCIDSIAAVPSDSVCLLSSESTVASYLADILPLAAFPNDSEMTSQSIRSKAF